MPPCHNVAKTARAQYHHCKFFPAGVNFNEEAVGQNWQGRGVLVLSLVPLQFFEYVQNFWSTLIGINFKKKLELFSFLSKLA
jgi:hypothetical protein